MDDAERYRAQAAAMVSAAEKALTAEEREGYLKLALEWNRLAQNTLLVPQDDEIR